MFGKTRPAVPEASYVFGVRNNIPYEPAGAGTIQSFQKEGAEYVYYGNDFQ